MLLRIKQLKEIDSLGYLFRHVKTGARLVYLQNSDDNKVFSIGFKTIPLNSKGIPHILEHSVLCGSSKYNVKDPFLILNRSSLNTFLNASTYPDKTTYPVGSRNNKDFNNLVSVYLDAVFHPNVLKKEVIFMQEGWHYYLKDSKNELVKNGVVLNEMKGVFSSPESLLYYEITKSLFPDTQYFFESGGDPDAISELEYHELVDFYTKNYHPSNSYIYFYGDLDIKKYLEKLDKEYLSQYKKARRNNKIRKQEAFAQPRLKLAHYSIDKSEKPDQKSYYSLNWVCDYSYKKQEAVAIAILDYLLIEGESGLIKQAILDAQLGTDVFAIFEQDLYQTFYSIVIKGTDEKNFNKIDELVTKKLIELINNGIPPKLIESTINVFEFITRESDYGRTPKGLVYFDNMMRSWLYGYSPFKMLDFITTIKRISRLASKGYLEELLEKYFIQNNHKSIVALLPQKGLVEKMAEKEKSELISIKKRLSDTETVDIISKSKKLDSFRNNKDSPKDLASIPTLLLTDVDRKVKPIEKHIENYDDIETLFYPLSTKGILYSSIYFDSNHVPYEKLKYLELFVYLLTNVDTTNYSYSDLEVEINNNTGQISLETEIIPSVVDIDSYRIFTSITGKCLYRNSDEMFNLFNEICLHSKFDDKKRIKELVKKLRSRIEMSIIDNGNVYAMLRLGSYSSKTGVLSEQTSGLSFYEFIRHIDQDFDNLFENLRKELYLIQKLVFNLQNCHITYCCENDTRNKISKSFDRLTEGLGNSEIITCPYNIDLYNQNEAFISQSLVQYVVKGYNFKQLGLEYEGVHFVLRNLLSNDYLWNKVRVEGGAYGAWCQIDRFGNLSFVSYRDPNLSQTLNAYDFVPSVLKNYRITKEELKNNIIGTIGTLDIPLTNSILYERENTRYWAGIDAEFIQRERDQILSCSLKDIRKCGELVSKVLEMNRYCVIGNKSVINNDKSLFDKIVVI